jgi:hypothetical protein
MHTVYRGAENVEARIKAAVKAHYAARGRMPRTMVVPKVELGEAREAAERLELSKVEIVGSGGCLIPEIWLGDGHNGD